MIKIDQSSEQNILNMLMEHSLVDFNQVKKITEISKESGKSRLEIAFDLNYADEAKVLKLLSTSYSLPIIDLKDHVLSEDIKKIIPINYIQTNSLVPFDISGLEELGVIPFRKTYDHMIECAEILTNPPQCSGVPIS